MSVQPTLFDEETTPGRIDDYLGVPGLILYRSLLDHQEQVGTLTAIDRQPWRDDLKRRVQHYGYRYDYRARTVDHSMRIGELPPFAVTVAQKLFDLGLVTELPDQLIVNEYLPGQGITAHIDCVPCFKDRIVTVSLGSVYEMDFIHSQTGECRSTPLELGSALIMTGPARYEWMHQIKGRKSDGGTPRGRRVSLTFRKVILTGDEQ